MTNFIYNKLRKYISVCSLLLFIIPVITLFVCFQIIAYHYPDFHTIPFVDGKASVSQIGRGVKTIGIFKSGFLLYMFVSIFFYFKIANFFLLKGIKNNFKIYGSLANFLLCIYIFALGKDGSFYEISRRFAIIFYIAAIYINHIYLIKILRLLKSEKKIQFNIIYSIIFYTIIAFMTILAIIGLPWVNPFFKYPDQLKNIVEWNFFLLTIIFYIPLSSMFYQFGKQA